jgi:hypothetical protein
MTHGTAKAIEIARLAISNFLIIAKPPKQMFVIDSKQPKTSRHGSFDLPPTDSVDEFFSFAVIREQLAGEQPKFSVGRELNTAVIEGAPQETSTNTDNRWVGSFYYSLN